MNPCKTAKTMRFHVYDIVYDVKDLTRNCFEPKNHRDTGREFTITDPDDTRPFWELYYGTGRSATRTINYVSIANVLMKKLFGFNTTGYSTRWTSAEKEFVEGEVSGLWFIKRVI